MEVRVDEVVFADVVVDARVVEVVVDLRVVVVVDVVVDVVVGPEIE